MSPPDFDGEPVTPEGLTALKAELYELETKGRREMAKRILAARELGDLKENAEYHAAKEDQAHMETRIRRLQRRLRSAVVVHTSAQAEVVAFGNTAEVLDELEMIEVKQGPYVGEQDKTRFVGIDRSQVKLPD